MSSTRPGSEPVARELDAKTETDPSLSSEPAAETARNVSVNRESGEDEGPISSDSTGTRAGSSSFSGDGERVALLDRDRVVSSAGGGVETDLTVTAPDGSESSPHKVRPFQSVLDLLHDLAIAVVVCIVLITYVVQAFKVQGTSMSPALKDGERILVNKLEYRIGDIDRGDVVVFWYPDDPDLSFIKRVVGLPGETVEIVNGRVYIDGRILDEGYVSAENADGRSHPKREVRPGHYFVLGDNRGGSNDSRSWGFVPERYIYGKAFVRLWPLGEAGLVE